MAHYVLSDLHGEGDRFHAMLEKIRLCEHDTLYILGDVVDRGPDGIALLREIMATPNMVMLLGNHEHMMLQYLAPDADPVVIRRWDKNGNGPTLKAFRNLTEGEQTRILAYLESLPSHLEIEVLGNRFYLVHGFPGSTAFDEVWSRPKLDTPSPLADCRVVIGHTPVQYLIHPEEARNAYVQEVEARGDHLRICHTEGFMDIDCGCGHVSSVKALACIRLEDMAEFYT